MNLHEAIAAAGMTPPQSIPPGRFVRFPGAGKGRANRSGWCRVITPTMAVFGDWSTGLVETWKDAQHADTGESRRLLAMAREREREYAAEQRKRNEEASQKARELISASQTATHPYLARKGFPDHLGFVHMGSLVIPMRSLADYQRVVGAQLIEADGSKKFLPGTKASAAVYRFGRPGSKHTVLCEGYATGLSIKAACDLFTSSVQVLVCFSATNLERVAREVPGVVAADNDKSGTGERVAVGTGLRWTMPYEVGTDFNDLHLAMGIHAVAQRIRELLVT